MNDSPEEPSDNEPSDNEPSDDGSDPGLTGDPTGDLPGPTGDLPGPTGDPEQGSPEDESVEQDSVEQDPIEEDSVEEDSVEEDSVEEDSVEEESLGEGSVEKGSFEEKLAANPELRRYAEDAVSYHEEALSENTRRAYESGARLTGGEERHLRLLELRNRALILLGYAAALRRSEIAALRFEDLRREPGHGLVIEVREGKTDQEGHGREIYVPRLESDYDPVEALDTWREETRREEGPVFRAITRGGNVKENSITGRTVGNVVREAVRLAGLSDPESYSAHSLRAGHATQATQNGVPAEIAMNTTRHASREQFSEYVRNEEEAFQSASSGKLGL